MLPVLASLRRASLMDWTIVGILLYIGYINHFSSLSLSLSLSPALQLNPLILPTSLKSL